MKATAKNIETIASDFGPVVVFPSGGACWVMAGENIRCLSGEMIERFKTELWIFFERSVKWAHKRSG